MKTLFSTTVILTFLATAGLVVADFTGFWQLAVFPYLWSMACVAVITPGSLLGFLLPEPRKRIGAFLLTANPAAALLLITLVNLSPSVKIMMHI